MSIGISLDLARNWGAVGDKVDEGGSGEDDLSSPECCGREARVELLREIMKVTESGELWDGGSDGEEL